MSIKRALVIGGSVGGLFAAGLLRDAGWKVAIFERSGEDLAGRGSGIGTHKDLFRILGRIGIAPDPSIGVRVRSRLCLDRSGAVVHERIVPATNSAWDRIYRPLKDAMPAACYHAGMRLDAFEERANGITAIFADGTSATGELLIGADGLYSTVRRLLAPEAEPRYAGYVAWRGVLEEEEIPPAIHAALFEHFTFCLPESELMLTLPMPGRDDDTRVGRRRFHWCWYRPVDFQHELPLLCTDAGGHCHGVTIAPPLIRPAVIAELEAHADAVLAPQIAALVRRTAQKLLQPIYDVESPCIGRGHVALVGDAAFVARPHVAIGVTKAARDAESLANALAADSDPRAALQAYDRERRPYGSALVARARALGAYLEGSARGSSSAALQQRPETVLREYGAAGSAAESVDAPG